MPVHSRKKQTKLKQSKVEPVSEDEEDLVISDSEEESDTNESGGEEVSTKDTSETTTTEPEETSEETSVKKAPVKKTSTKKAPVKKTSTKKAPAKKTSTKKAPAKAPTKKTPAKKTPTKTSTKKTPTKTSTKKTPAKAPAKKAPTKKTSTKKTPTRKAPIAPKTSSGEKKKRFFKILLDSIEPVDSPAINTDILNSKGGRYTGHNPMQAAKKACRRIARAGPTNGECCYIFSVQETTQGSAKKVFRYVGERIKLTKPSVIKKGDATYNVYFDINVRSYKGPESLKRKSTA